MFLDAHYALSGVSGTVQLDSNGDRIGDYWLWHIPQKRSAYEKWGEVRMTDREAGNEVGIITHIHYVRFRRLFI